MLSFRTQKPLSIQNQLKKMNDKNTLKVCSSGMKALRDRMESVKSTKKITDAMKLVAAAKVRRAQEAVLNGRPFAENLVKVLYGVNQRLQDEDVDSPLTTIRPVKTVLLVVVTGDRGLCGGYNNFVIKKSVARIQELNEMGVQCKILNIGRKGSSFFKRRANKYKLSKQFGLGGAPTTKEAQAMADEIFAEFVSQEVDKVELLYTKFVSLINSEPTIQTLLPMARSGELCDINGKCVDFAEDEVFRLTTMDGKMSVARDKIDMSTSQLDSLLIFEQEPSQILDALLPLYMNSTVLRSLQESLASELAARMNAMNSASDNASALGKTLSQVYNRKRQAAITNQLIEIISGASAV
jgi:F-type H+-transporting ATPase subunit gamma